MKLYEISNAYQSAFSKLEEIGFDAETIKDSLIGIEDDFNKKALSVANYLENLSADIVAVEEMYNKISAKRKSLKNTHQNLRDYLTRNMSALQIPQIKCPYFTITHKQNPIKISEEIDMADIPGQYVITEVSQRVDKAKIHGDLKSEVLTGLESWLKTERTESVTIK